MCRLIKLFIFIPLTHWACCVQAQFGFEKTIKFSLDAEDPWFIFEDQQGHFIITATTAVDAQRSLLAIKLKPKGNTQWLCNYGISLEYDDMFWGTQLNNQYYFLGGGGSGEVGCLAGLATMGWFCKILCTATAAFLI